MNANQNQNFYDRMKFDIYKRRNKSKLVEEAGKTFDRNIDRHYSKSEVRSLFDRLHTEAITRKETKLSN